MVVTNVLINHGNVHSEANMAADSVIFKHTFFTFSHELQEISTQKLQIFPWNTKHFIKNIFYMAFSSCKQHLLKIICLQSHPYFRNILLLVVKRKISNNVHHFVFLCQSVASIVILVTNSQFLFHSFSLQKTGTDAK